MLALSLMVTQPGIGSAQDTEGSGWAAVGGAALGLYSGGLLGFVGGLVPCSQTYSGPACIRASAAGGGLIAMASGIAIGAGDIDRLGSIATSTAIGAGVGTAMGLALVPLAQRVGWRDVAAIGLLGGAVGAQPVGSVIGLGAGAVLGGALMLTVPAIRFPDAIGFATAGLAVGALAAWIADAVDSHRSGTAETHIVLPIQIRF